MDPILIEITELFLSVAANDKRWHKERNEFEQFKQRLKAKKISPTTISSVSNIDQLKRFEPSDLPSYQTTSSDNGSLDLKYSLLTNTISTYVLQILLQSYPSEQAYTGAVPTNSPFLLHGIQSQGRYNTQPSYNPVIPENYIHGIQMNNGFKNDLNYGIGMPSVLPGRTQINGASAKNLNDGYNILASVGHKWQYNNVPAAAQFIGK